MKYVVMADCINTDQRCYKRGEFASYPDGFKVSKYLVPYCPPEDDPDLKVFVDAVVPAKDAVATKEDAVMEIEDLQEMSKNELLSLASDEGVSIPLRSNKDTIISLIRSARG
jgi:hypothetical protein